MSKTSIVTDEAVSSTADQALSQPLAPSNADSQPTPDKPQIVTLVGKTTNSYSGMSFWDPRHSPDWDQETPSLNTMSRLKKDITEIYKDPPPGVVLLPDRDDLTRLHAIITGPFDTPYEGGYFIFLIRCPPDYPIKPPRVLLLTTGKGTVRFNPNFYKNGKVCLSILGTWSGPGWSPAQSLSSLLISIQSLMCENPYHNEPGFVKERVVGDSKKYNNCIKHETIRVAVCEILEKCEMFSESIRDVVKTSFMNYYDYYVNACREFIKMDGKVMEDPFGENRGNFAFKDIQKRLEAIKAKLDKEMGGDLDEATPSTS